MLSLIKGKLMTFGGVVIGLLLLAVTLLSRSIEKLRREKVEQELEDTEASQKVSRRANEAMIKGVANEGDTEDNPRKYKFGNHS